MSRLWTPPKVARELRESSAERRARLLEQFEHRGMTQAAWNLTLRQIDPHLRLVKAHDNADFPGVVPGYWHFLRDAPDPAIPTALPIHGPDFEFAEPTIGMLDKLRRGDLQDPRVVRDQQKALQEAERAKERDDEREKEERLEEVTERWAAATQTRVSMSDATPWTQNASANARRDAGARKRKAD